MFCKLGSLEDKRPVDVTVCIKFVWTRRVFGLICSCSASEYVLFSFEYWRHSRIFAAISTPSSTKVSKTAASVDHEPVFAFFVLPFNPILSNRIFPVCPGEFKLNSSPANSKICFSNADMRSPKTALKFFSSFSQTLMPLRSILNSTEMQGRSKSS